MELSFEVEYSGCCRLCPMRDEHYSPVSDQIRCRVNGEWNMEPDTLPAWCPALPQLCSEAWVDANGFHTS